MTSFDSLRKAQAKHSSSALDLVKKDPVLAASIAKMVPQPQGSGMTQGRTELLHSQTLQQAGLRRARRNADARAILEIHPDLELAIQILVSSTLSPTDMTSVKLAFAPPKGLLSSELTAALTHETKTFFEETYTIKSKLSQILRDMVAEKGAHVLAVIPENALDQFINSDIQVATEQLSEWFDLASGQPRPLGILGPSQIDTSTRLSFSFESLDRAQVAGIDQRLHYLIPEGDAALFGHGRQPILGLDVRDDYVRVVDNPAILKLPAVSERQRARAVRERMRAGLKTRPALESVDAVASRAGVDLKRLYRNPNYHTQPVAQLAPQHELRRKSVGMPLVMKLPSECVIPVYVPGDMTKHVGFFILLDEQGNPLEVPDGDHYRQGLVSANRTGAMGGNAAANLVQRIHGNFSSGDYDPNSQLHRTNIGMVYQQVVERDFANRIKNGVHSGAVKFAENEEFYRIMLARSALKKYTQVLYLPAEYMTYFAFDYGDDGLGRSLLDKSAMLNTMRSALLFAEVVGAMKNSIGRTKVNMELSAADPDPMRTVERFQHMAVQARQIGIPLGVSDPSDIMEWVQRAGYEWNISGNPQLPPIKVDYENIQTNHQKPDSDLSDLLRKMSIMALGLSPEVVDNGFNSEFATTVVSNNILLAKRIIALQEVFCPLLSDHLRKVAINSAGLVQTLKETLEQNVEGIKLELEDEFGEAAKTLAEDVKKKLLVTRALTLFLEGFTAELPKPPSITLEQQMTEFQTYTDALDKVLDAYISDEWLTGSTQGELSGEARTIKANLKAYFQRRWLAENAIMTELSELASLRDDGAPQLNVHQEIVDYIEILTKSEVIALAKLKPMIDAANKDLEKLKVDAEASSGPSDSGGDSGDSGSGDDMFGGGGDDMFGGGDDLGMGGMDDSLGGGDNPDAGGDEPPSDDANDNPDEDLDEEPKSDVL